MKKQIFAGLAVVGVLIAGLAITKYFQISSAIAQHSSFKPPPEAITSYIAAKAEWPRVHTAVGSVSSVQGATLAAEAAGRIAKVNVASGTLVKAGDVLVELDNTVEEAELRGAIARLEQTQKAYTRAQNLIAGNAMSKANLEESESAFVAAKSEVERLKAVIGRRTIKAPFDGRAGIREVNVGQFVSEGMTIIPVHALDKVFVDFTLPQTVLSTLTLGQKVSLSVEGYPTDKFEGTLTAMDPNVNASTRNVGLQATVDNSTEKLRPGMFVRILIEQGISDPVIALPATSVSFAPYGDTVYVIEGMKSPDGKDYRGVRQQVVKTGEKRGDQVAILSGVDPGQEIATSGIFKLRPGAEVAINNDFAPSNAIAPTPADT